ncbi:hypothetical protein [Methylobacterium platani]|uniref:MmgE/PrpD family protein n=2 Tax=Methylobacterium platani TaxID=427683 RepID=A0A179SFT1_9HYPH|nr:hypothetical protein [Methylobacterium platani]KMO11515.1 hypothetical protein SQ03_27025 [Methylobacterium platani JCM 14648]OAS26302.1 hypothetical protein A5481_06195 [Methylobacterium platani]
MTHPAFRAGYVSALYAIVEMIHGNATPADVAGYIVALGALGGAVSRAVEDQAHDGTFAAAVFDILCNG